MPQIKASTARLWIKRRLISSPDGDCASADKADIIDSTTAETTVFIMMHSLQFIPVLQRPNSVRAFDRRRRPASVQRLAPRRVKTHGEVELILRCGKPVCFLVSAGRLRLDQDIERAIAIEFQLVAVAERKT